MNETLLQWAQYGQVTVGILGIFMLLALAVGILYYIIARAFMGTFPGLYAPIAGDWFKVTMISTLVGAAAFGAIFVAITTAIGAGGWTGAF